MLTFFLGTSVSRSATNTIEGACSPNDQRKEEREREASDGFYSTTCWWAGSKRKQKENVTIDLFLFVCDRAPKISRQASFGWRGKVVGQLERILCLYLPFPALFFLELLSVPSTVDIAQPASFLFLVSLWADRVFTSHRTTELDKEDAPCFHLQNRVEAAKIFTRSFIALPSRTSGLFKMIGPHTVKEMVPHKVEESGLHTRRDPGAIFGKAAKPRRRGHRPARASKIMLVGEQHKMLLRRRLVWPISNR